MRRYVGASSLGRRYRDNVPELEQPLIARKLVTVFVSTEPGAVDEPEHGVQGD